MERRTFLWLSLAGTAGISIGCANNSDSDALFKLPGVLSHLCDEKTIRSIGSSYLGEAPAENDVDKLRDLLMMDENGNAVTDSKEVSSIESYLSNKIKRDFEQGKIVTVRGWILSITESRQCALYSLL